MKSSIMAVGWGLFAVGVTSNLVYVAYNWHSYRMGTALGYGVMAITGLVAQWVGEQLRDMQKRLDALEKRLGDGRR